MIPITFDWNQQCDDVHAHGHFISECDNFITCVTLADQAMPLSDQHILPPDVHLHSSRLICESATAASLWDKVSAMCP